MNLRFYKHYDRMGFEWHTSNFDLDVWVWRLSYRLRELKRAWREYRGPCPECGMKWGKHDKNVEHLPF